MMLLSPKTDRNLNSPRSVTTLTNIVSIKIKEILNWRIIFWLDITLNSRN